MDVLMLGDRQQNALGSVEAIGVEQLTGTQGRLIIHRLSPWKERDKKPQMHTVEHRFQEKHKGY